MARRIHVLPDAVANQIAAGEVVERPASVVKELLENALDARAQRIHVAIERGGKRRIRVSDDGVGMSREDALLCMDRHATSKIHDADDLRSIRSLGFRGEALPSIGAVSRLSLETREAGSEVGTRVRVAGGTMTGVEDCSRQRGTTVDVQKIFFNAPARAKFLKSVSAEARAVSDAVTTLALAHPEVAFELTSDGRTLLELPACKDVGRRVAALWGDEEAGALLYTSLERNGASVRGLVQRPDAAKPGLRRARLFVDGRPFEDPGLLAAADRAYRTTVARDVRPWLFLYLSVPPGDVDVNVHPAKAEVRFRDRGAVEELVEQAVREPLRGGESSATFDATVPPPPFVVRERPAEEASRPGGSEAQMALFLSGLRGEGDAEEGPVRATDGQDPASTPVGVARLWQLLDTYILAETREGVLIIDQHSAHERILFERMMDAFAEGGQEGQRLLFPLTLGLTPPEIARVEELGGLLARAGFEVEAFGGDAVIVHSVPNPHPWFDAERCLREMVRELTEGSDLVRSARNQHERIAMTFACKSAIKAGQKLGEEEMRELFDALFATELPFHDVHGRPTVVRLSAAELERKFGRH
jgi:DNA mismatch repair protein MutL